MELTVCPQPVVQGVVHLTQKTSISADSDIRFIFPLGAGFLNGFWNVHPWNFSGNSPARCHRDDIRGRTRKARDWKGETQTHDGLETGDVQLV